MTTAADRKQVALAPTDEERVGLFKTMYAYCGTYRIDGPKFITECSPEEGDPRRLERLKRMGL